MADIKLPFLENMLTHRCLQKRTVKYSMTLHNYFENLIFTNGHAINVSKKVDTGYFNLVHWHPYVEILFSLCDGNEVTVDFNKYSLKENDIVIVYSGNLHSVHYVTQDSFLVIQFPMSLLTAMSEIGNLQPILANQAVIFYEEEREECLQMIALIRQISALAGSNEPFCEVHIYTTLLEFFTWVGRYCLLSREENLSGDLKADYKNTKLMAEACLYISENCTSPLTLEETTRHLGISKSHFAHLFKQYTNMTFIDFLTAERIKCAESFFSNPQLRITDIAFEAGFSSISSFNRAFRKAKGCSPGEFRATMIDKDW